MKTPVAFAALLVVLNAPGGAFAQTAAPVPSSQTPRSGSGLTRDLNSLPPAAVAPAPSATPPASIPSSGTLPRAAIPSPAAATITPAPKPSAPVPTAPVTATPRPTPAPGAMTPTPTAPTPSAPTTGAVAPARATAPATAIAPAAEPATEPAPEPPVMTVLNPAAITALPFTLELPAGFRITTGRPGPDFKIYTIRRGEQSFVTVYAGPASQFPIYTGETVQAGGRASVVVPDQTGQRHALEHLFQRATAPREIHVWTSSLDGADQALAEQIAQSVDDR